MLICSLARPVHDDLTFTSLSAVFKMPAEFFSRTRMDAPNFINAGHLRCFAFSNIINNA